MGELKFCGSCWERRHVHHPMNLIQRNWNIVYWSHQSWYRQWKITRQIDTFFNKLCVTIFAFFMFVYRVRQSMFCSDFGFNVKKWWLLCVGLCPFYLFILQKDQNREPVLKCWFHNLKSCVNPEIMWFIGVFYRIMSERMFRWLSRLNALKKCHLKCKMMMCNVTSHVRCIEVFFNYMIFWANNSWFYRSFKPIKMWCL